MTPAIICQFTHGNSPVKIKGKTYVMAENKAGRLVARDSGYPLDGPRDVARSLATVLSRKPDTTPDPKGGPLA